MPEWRACADCGAKSPNLVLRNRGYVCRNRAACEARQMLQRGEGVAEATAHAHEPVSDEMVQHFLEQAAIDRSVLQDGRPEYVRRALRAALTGKVGP